MTSTKARLAAIALALPLALAACSDSAEETPTPVTETTEATTAEETEQATETGSAEETSAPAEETSAPAEETSDAATQDGGSDSADASGEKPSREDVTTGLKNMMAQMGYSAETFAAQGISEEQMDGYFTCIVDETYDKISPTFATAIAEGDDSASISPEDMEVFNASVQTCVDQIQPGGN